MSRDEFRDLLARAVVDELITEAQAVELLRRFDAGLIEFDESDLPLPLAQAIQPADSSRVDDALAALLLLGLLSRLGVRSADDFYALSPAARLEAHELLFDSFLVRARALAAEYEATGSLLEFHAGAQRLVTDSIIQQALLGKGSPLSYSEVVLVDEAVRLQQAYLLRFADQIALAQAEEVEAVALMSEAQIASRLEMYDGEARAWYYLAESLHSPPGTVVDYVALDDANTCAACLEAEANSPYLPDDPDAPVPGRECYGSSRCRCRRVLRYSPDEARELGANF